MTRFLVVAPLGRVIQMRRLERRESLPQVADAAGITKQALSNIEQGKVANPGFWHIVDILQHLELSVDDLLSKAVRP